MCLDVFFSPLRIAWVSILCLRFTGVLRLALECVSSTFFSHRSSLAASLSGFQRQPFLYMACCCGPVTL